jgi:DNA-directed RNA polymerase subunit M/transcription elongation factor TFIIS
MHGMDGVEESRRLQEWYAHLTDEELQSVADDVYELTDVAKQALQVEIRGRGLQIQLKDASTPPRSDQGERDFDPSDLDLVVANRVWDLSEARQVKGILDDAGIPSYLGPDNIEDVEAFKSSFENGVDLKVRYIDNQRALQAISQALPPGPEGEKEYVALCPKCHSNEIVFEGRDTTPEAEPASDERFNWSCDGCGYRWRDDGVENEA